MSAEEAGSRLPPAAITMAGNAFEVLGSHQRMGPQHLEFAIQRSAGGLRGLVGVVAVALVFRRT